MSTCVARQVRPVAPRFPCSVVEEYRRRHDDAELITMPDLEDPQDEWEMEKVRDKRRIKGVMHYLVKWAGWPSEYNSYEPASHLFIRIG